MQFNVSLSLKGADTTFNPAGAHPRLRAAPMVNIKSIPPGLRRQLILIRLVVATRLLLLLLAAGGVAASILVSVRGARTAEAGAALVCPMHPEVRARAPGRCPLCGMPLSARTPSQPAASLADTTAMDNIRRHRITDVVRQRSLLFDARELRGAAWVDEDGLVTAVYYDDQIDVLPPGERGWFSPSQAPQSPFPVRRTSEAKVRWDRSTSRIRFRVDGAAPTRSVGPTPDATLPDAFS